MFVNSLLMREKIVNIINKWDAYNVSFEFNERLIQYALPKLPHKIHPKI